MLQDLIDPKKARRILAYAILLLFTLLVQNAVFSRISFFGVKALFLPAACVAVGMFEGGVGGAAFGLFLGFFGDMSFAENTVLFTALFPVIGFFAGFAEAFFLNRRFFPFMAASLAALLLTGLLQAGTASILSGNAFAPLLKTVGLQTLWSLPEAAVFYPIVKSMSARLPSGTMRKERK
jgi:hypothetical protein